MQTAHHCHADRSLRIGVCAALVLHKSKAARLLSHLVDGDVDVRDAAKGLEDRAQVPNILVPLRPSKHCSTMLSKSSLDFWANEKNAYGALHATI